MEAHKESVREVLVLARRAGIIPEDWVADTRAPEPDAPLEYDDAEDLARAVAATARDAVFGANGLQSGQDRYLEILCEAAELIPRVSRVAHLFGVHVYSGAGFDGLKAKRAIAERAGRRSLVGTRPSCVSTSSSSAPTA